MSSSNQNLFPSVLIKGYHKITTADLSALTHNSPHPHHFCLPTFFTLLCFKKCRFTFFVPFNLLFSLPNILPLAPTLMKYIFENEYFCNNINCIILYLFVYVSSHPLEYECSLLWQLGREFHSKKHAIKTRVLG